MLTSSDIFNRPPAIAEDTLQYELYPSQDLSDKGSVTSLAASILAVVEDQLLQDFVWHRDSFELKVAKKNPESDGYILRGRMRVGDSIDDEWSVVWLLKLISASATWDDWNLAISLFDSDGEFLLIEAAEALPAWVKPSNSENRVWIYNSRLHLIPLTHISPPSRRKHRRQLPGRPESDDDELAVENDNEWISANDAANVIRDPFIDTLAPEAVEKLVWQRISGYPAALKDHVHVTKAWIPVDIAKALTANPFLVQRAVEAFYTRDALQLRSAHRMLRFPPDTSVLRPIRITRTAYAQLVGQKFFPPKVFGHWQEKEATREWSWRDVGMKIAVGFEMLYQEKARHDAIETAESVKSSTDANKDALRRDPHHVKYLQILAATDYFKGEIQGSALWKDLETKAATVYINVRSKDDASRPSFTSQVKLAIAQVSSLPEVPDHEDSDNWLNVDAQDFDELIEKTMGISKAEQRKPSDEMDINENSDDAEERLASAQATKLKELATKVEKFVEGEGDIEGAIFEDEELSDEEFSDDEDVATEDGEDSDVMMDTQEMSQEEKAERQAAMDRLVPALDPSEYGKMPASFHSNSQRVTAPTIGTDEVEDKEKQAPTDLSARERRIRPPILQRDKFDGVDSDDDSDEEEDDEESEEEKPQVVGEVEIDMAEEEEEFLEFSRQALGITDEHWNEIILDRKSRGAFLPASAIAKPPKAKEEHFSMPIAREEESDKAKASSRAKSGANPKLDSFEAVMKAMDEELGRVRNTSQKTAPSNSKGKGKAQDASIEEGHDIEAAMEAELRASLERDEEEEEEEITEDVDYNLIKNFLESFKSQEGLAGPVSSMAGRLQPEWKLPREFGGSS